MEHTAHFDFRDGLDDLLVRRYRPGPAVYRFREHPGIKDPIETLGVPHTEVDVILVNGRSVTFDYRLQDGDVVTVFPVQTDLVVTPLLHLSPPDPNPVTFILDVHLGKLARRLRLLGLDCLYYNDLADDELIRLSLEQGRVLLTRDLGILKQRCVVHGTLVRSDQVDVQVRQVIVRYRLLSQLRPWLRCMVCNGLMGEVAKDEVLDRLEPKTRQYYDAFHRCADCGRVYWQGSHLARIRDWLAELLAG